MAEKQILGKRYILPKGERSLYFVPIVKNQWVLLQPTVLDRYHKLPLTVEPGWQLFWSASVSHSSLPYPYLKEP
ncbi:MAG: hypothetical protein SWY16_19000 [Cyanobacteriota bacterium]|nr:hypothetical protein [Cyanobacteriota bacterium]